MTKKEMKKLERDALDLLNQAVILLKDVKYQEQFLYSDSDDGGCDEKENPDHCDENRFLSTIKLICKDLVNNKQNGEVMEYYQSYCYWEDV